MRFYSQILVALLIVVTLPVSEIAFAASSVEDRLQDLEQQIAVLKRQLEIEKDEKKASRAPVITASSKDGFSIKSPDDSFKIKLRGLVQLDGRYFTDNQKDNGTTDTFSVRRARPILEGALNKNFDFYIMPDFGSGASTLVDAYSEFKLDPAFKFRAGKFKAPLGLERLQSDAVANFTEVGLPSNLLSNREVGLQLSGDLFGDSLSYAVGIFNGSPDLGSSTAQDTDNNNDKDVVGRVFAQPFKNGGPEVFKGLGVGVAGSYGHKEGATTPSYRSTGQATIFSYASTSADGQHVRITPQAYYYNGSLGLIGEYASSEQKFIRGNIIRDTFKNETWQIAGNYVLTGESASYKGINPRTNFDLSKGTWGAFEAVGRYGNLDIDDSIFTNGFASTVTSVTEANAWGAGLNWYLNKNYRISLDFEQTRFDGGSNAGADRQTENVILSRFQIAY